MNAEKSPNRKLVERLFASLAQGDMEGIRSVLHPDAVWNVMAQGIRNAGAHKGRDTIVDEFLSGGFGRFVEGGPRILIDNVVEAGDQLAVQGHADSPLQNGKHYRNLFAFFFRVQDSLLISVCEHVDTRYALETFA